MTSMTFRVTGLPAPQGSKKAFVRGGRAMLVESAGDKVKSWRQDVVVTARTAAERRRWAPLTGPVAVELVFFLPRPKGHYGSGKNVGRVRPTAPAFPATKADLDKSTRATVDALSTAGVFRDDSQVVRLLALKHYADGVTAGATITIEDLT